MNQVAESDKVIFFNVNSVPKDSPLRLSFRYDSGAIGFSMSLYRLLGVGDCRRVTFIIRGKAMYVTLTDDPLGFWLLIGKNSAGKISSVETRSKAFVQKIMRDWGYLPGDVCTIAVIKNPIPANEVDQPNWPYPIYRLQINPGA